MNAAKKSRPLAAFGVLVRATRLKKGLTQQLAANGATVSRKQWALLEQGHNASADFIRKVAAFLDLRVVPLGDNVEATLGGAGIDITMLFRLADELIELSTAFAERLRTFALDAAMPPSERGADARAIGALAERDGEAARHGAAVSRAIQNLAGEAVPKRPPSARAVSPSTERRKRGSRPRG